MGIERSYKAFFGFEISAGSFWNSKACISIEKEHSTTHGDRVSDGGDTFRNQMRAFEDQGKVKNPEKTADHVEDAVFEMMGEDGLSRENMRSETRKDRKVREPVTVSRRLKTYMHASNHAPKGSLLDFSV